MGKFKAWAEKKVKRMGLFDIALLKVCLFLAGLIVGAYTWAFIRNWIWYFASVTVFVYLILLVRFFRKK